MPLNVTTTLKRLLPSPLAVQGVVALAALVFALSPAQGGTALYLPLAGGDMASAVAWSRDNGARLLAPGPYDGAFIIRVNAGEDSLAAYSSGALLISVPEFLCGGPETESAGMS